MNGNELLGMNGINRTQTQFDRAFIDPNNDIIDEVLMVCCMHKTN